VPLGKADDFLIKAEKAANVRGVRELGLVHGPDNGLEALIRACESGELKGLYLCGGDPASSALPERLVAQLARLELLIAQDVRPAPLFARTQVVFPSTPFAGKDGTFTNHAGRVQRIQRALEPEPGWCTDGEIFIRLLNRLESRQEKFTLPRVWAAMERDGSAFARLRFETIGPEGAALDSSATESESSTGAQAGQSAAGS
jgi:predicted molibdopterin-dependent oxidoreductase YjgC